MTLEFNRLTKMNFDVRMAEPSKNVATKQQVQNGLDLGDRNENKFPKSCKHLV